MKTANGASFASLFKKFRLRSEIETLAEFGDLLAEEGIVYETSLFTRWQKGERVPRDRKVVLTVIKVFAKHRGLQSIEEVNMLLESAHQRDLIEDELSEIAAYVRSQKNITLPNNPEIFIGREKLIKNITWELINKRHIWMYGLPGIGKTSLALYLAYLLQDVFPDGIFWFRTDIKDTQIILDEFLTNLGYNPVGINNNINFKLDKLSTLVRNRQILLILDNISSSLISKSEIKHFFSLPIAIICTSIEDTKFDYVKKIQLLSFTPHEFICLSEKVLGELFVKEHKKEIEQLGELLGHLPISSMIVLKQIFLNPIQLKTFIRQVKQQKLDYRKVFYDNKNLYSAFDFSFSKINPKQQNLLISCSLFDGADFSIDSLAYLNNSTKLNIRSQLKELLRLSFIEASINDRYRLHPTIKDILIKKVKREQYIKLAQFYIKKLKTYPEGSKQYMRYLMFEFENIVALIKRCYKFKNYITTISLWPFISMYVFYSGNWHLMLKYDYLIQKTFKKIENYQGLIKYLLEDIGRVYFFQNKLAKVYELLSLSFQIAKKHKDQLMLGLIKQKYGIIYNHIGELNKAEQKLKEAIKILNNKETEDEYIKSFAYLSMVYGKMNRFQLAVQYGVQAINKSHFLKDKTIVGHTSIFLARAYLHLNKFNLAKKYFLNGYKTMKKWKVKIGEALSLQGLGEIYYRENKRQKAIRTLEKSLELFNQLGMKENELEVKELLLYLSKEVK